MEKDTPQDDLQALLDANEPTPGDVDTALDAHDAPQEPDASLTDEEIAAQTEPVALDDDDVQVAVDSSSDVLKPFLEAD